MKYMIMTFGDASAWDTLGLGGAEATWSEEEVAEHFRGMSACYADLAASGERWSPASDWPTRRTP